MALKSFMAARVERDEPEVRDTLPATAPSAPTLRTVAPSTSAPPSAMLSLLAGGSSNAYIESA